MTEDDPSALLPGAAVDHTTRPAADLGMQLRFDGGKTVLTLEGRRLTGGGEIRRALFAAVAGTGSPDVASGALGYRDKPLVLRAIELVLPVDAIAVAASLRPHGIQLLRDRPRAGGLDLLLQVDAAKSAAAVAVDARASRVKTSPVRARVVAVPAGEGLLLVVDQLIGLPKLPRAALDVARLLLDGIHLPGSEPTEAMTRRAFPLAAVCTREFPLHGWKIPVLGEVRIRDLTLARGELIVRAWSDPIPEGWRPARDHTRAVVDSAALQTLTAAVSSDVDDLGRLSALESLVAAGGLVPSAIPFVVDALARAGVASTQLDLLLGQAMERDGGHLGVLAAAAVAVDGLSPDEQCSRWRRLAAAADDDDDPWVAARAGIAAAQAAEQADDLESAVECASAAVDADPTLAEAGRELARLLIKKGEPRQALVVGRAALERAGQGSVVDSAADLDAADAFAVQLSAVARQVEGVAAARELLQRALRLRERADALQALALLETDDGNTESARDALLRLRAAADDHPALLVDVEILSADLAEAAGDVRAARAHVQAAQKLIPAEPRVALRLARHAEADAGIDAAIDVLAPVVDAWLAGAEDDETCKAARAAARLLVMRAADAANHDDAVGARRILARLLSTAPHDAALHRLDAEARAALGEGRPLAALLLADAGAAPAVTDGGGQGVRLRVRAAALLAAAGDAREAADAWRGAWDAAGDANTRALVDRGAWLAAVRGAADPERLGALLSRVDVRGLDLSPVVTTFLRAALAYVTEADARREGLAVLAARHADVGDAERWLEASRTLPASERAAHFVHAARQWRRVDWMLAGLELLEQEGSPRRALEHAREAIDAEPMFSVDTAILERAFHLAIVVDEPNAIDEAAEALLAFVDTDAHRRDVFRQQVAAHGRAIDDDARRERQRSAWQVWSEAFPGDVEPVEPLVDHLLHLGDVEGAVAILDRACAGGVGAAVSPVLSRVAQAARETNAAVEIRAHELLLGVSLDTDARARVERQLVDLYVREARIPRAVGLLTAMAGRDDIDDVARATLWWEIAALHEGAGDPTAAIAALEQALHATPDDDDTSAQLRALCLEAGDQMALERECLRRASRPGPSAERSDLLVRAGDLARSAGRLFDARRSWLRALRGRFSSDAWQRLTGCAAETGSTRLPVRAHLAAARARRSTEPLLAIDHGLEAARLLSESHGRPRTALRVLSWWERSAEAAGVEHPTLALRHATMLRDLGEGAAAKRRLDVLIAVADDVACAALLTLRASVSADLLGDEEAALADRRAALKLVPTATEAARALSEQLRRRGDLRGAFEVDRNLLISTCGGASRAVALGELAAAAMTELGDADAGFIDDLCTESLRDQDSVDIRRRQLRVRTTLGDHTRIEESLAALLRHPIDALERVAVATRLALLREQAGDPGAAADALLVVDLDEKCASLPSHDHLIMRLTGLLERAGRPRDAADVIVRALRRWPEGTAALGGRTAVLQRAAAWLDDDGGGRADDALALLGQAAAAGPLDNDSEIRRARLAEKQERPDIAIAALESLIARDVDVAANAVRLASAAEAWGEPERACVAWQLRATRVPTDAAAWLAVERLATVLGHDDGLRAARERLIELDVGTREEQASRALGCARDARDRLADLAAAVRWLTLARSLQASHAIRQESLAVAVAAADVTAELAVLDEIVAAGGPVSGHERLRRASLRLAADTNTASTALALEDVVAAVDQSGSSSTFLEVAVAVARRDLGAFVNALWATRASSLRTALVAAIPSEDGTPLRDDAVLQLADAFPEDVTLVSWAARRELDAGRADGATDRLLSLAALPSLAVDRARSLVDEAARCALAGGATTLAPRLDSLRPALRRHPSMRQEAIALLSTARAWEQLAWVLDDAIVVADIVQERRLLRMHLATVLREGVGGGAALGRAADQLEALIDEDAGDEEVWPSLLVCLEELGDRQRLQAALARRARSLAGPARRDVVQRRTVVLLELGRGVEGLEDLRAVRRDSDDAVLKALEQAIHVAVDADDPDPAFRTGGPALARFLDDELALRPCVEDARALLALPTGAATPGARVRARIALLALTGDDVDAHAVALLAPGPGGPPLARIDEAIAVVESAARGRHPEVRGRASGLAASLARHAGTLGSRDALRLVDALLAAADDLDDDDVVHAVVAAAGVATVARRWRLRGPRATATDIARLDQPTRAVLGLRRAARIADAASLHAHLQTLGLDLQLADGHAAEARQLVVSRAEERERQAARGTAGDLALLRHGNPRGLQRALARNDQERRHVAVAARRLRLLAGRLEARLALALAPNVARSPEELIAELRAVQACAATWTRTDVESAALDEIMSRGPPDCADLVRRADLACTAHHDDATTWCERAAEAASHDAAWHEPAARLRRWVVQEQLRRGDQTRLAQALLALARSPGPRDAVEARRKEAISIAEVVQLVDVVDELVADETSAEHAVPKRLAAVRQRVKLRLDAHRPRDAFRVLVEAAAADAGLAREARDEAYALAARHALVAEMLEVVDDDLARAGLLAVLGRRAEAVAVARTLDEPAACWLRAGCARRAGDFEDEEAALAELAARGLADHASTARLLATAERRGDRAAIARHALGLVAGATIRRDDLATVVRTLAALPPAFRIGPVQQLLARATSGKARGLDDGAVASLLGAVLELAKDLARAGHPATLREARHAWARHRDDDDAWIDAAAADLDVDDVTLRSTLAPLWRRSGVVDGLLARADTVDRAICLARVIRADVDDAVVFDALHGRSNLPWPVAEVVATGLEQRGRGIEAAELLARVLQTATSAGDVPRRELRLRACSLLLAADEGGAAARLMQGILRDELDETTVRRVSEVIVTAAQSGAMADAARLAMRVARQTGDERFRVRAMGMADAAGGDVALEVGRWCLGARDVRALPLLAHHCPGPAKARDFFGAWHGLLTGPLQAGPQAPADFELVARLRDNVGSLPPTALSPGRSLLARARVNRPARRAEAWVALAASVATRDRDAAARMFGRSGLAMSAAPLELRLAWDPTLSPTTAPSARAAAIVAGLAGVPAPQRPAVVAAFDELSLRGATSARQRLAVDELAARIRPAIDVAIDVSACGGVVDVGALLRGLGRRPEPSTRAAVAACLASLGLEQLGAAVAPTLRSTSTVDVWSAERARMQKDGDDLARLGHLRLAQTGGPRLDIERELLALAERLGREALVVESLHRMACLSTEPQERAQHLLRRAALLVTVAPERAWRSALASLRIDPTEHAARVLTELAERTGDPRRMATALGAWARSASTPEARVDTTLRQAGLLAGPLGDPAGALALLSEAAGRTPRVALFRAQMALATEHLRDPRAAAHVALAAATHAVDVDDATRIPLLREAAAAFVVDAHPDATEQAVKALCLAFQAGDAAALAEAEHLARSRTCRGGLAVVLDLRLRVTDDLHVRRPLVLERARLLADLDDKMGAFALLEAQTVDDEGDVDARLTLGLWYRAEQRVLDAAQAYESAARVPGLPPEQLGPSAREAAVLFAGSGDLDRAGPLAERAVAAGFADVEVLRVAEAWNRARENWLAVDDLLGRELELVTDPHRAAQIWVERSLLRRERTADEQGARKALAQALELQPDHPRALQLLREEARRTDAWGGLRAGLLRASEATTDRRARGSILREIAEIDTTHLNDLRAGLALVDRALELVPDDVDALVLKATWMVRAGKVDGVAGLIDRIERAGGDTSRLPGQLHVVRGDALRVAGDAEAARLSFERATGDPEASATAWDRLIDMVSETPHAVTLLERARRHALDPSRRVTWAKQELQLRRKLLPQSGDLQGAVAVALDVLAVDPGDSEALDFACDSLLQDGRTADVLGLLAAWARTVDGDTAPRERASRLARAGAFALTVRQDEGAARLLLDEALVLWDDEPVALVHLADLAWAARDDERGLELLDRISPAMWRAAAGDDDARVPSELLYRRARCAYALGHADAQTRLHRVLDEDPQHFRALEMLSRVAAEQGDDDDADFALGRLAQALPPEQDTERLVTVLLDLANLKARRGHIVEAVAAAERAFALDPSSLTVLELVADLRHEAGKKIAAADAWRLVAAQKTGPERRKTLERRARALTDADQVVDAIDAWNELFRESDDPRHRREADALAARATTATESGRALPIVAAAEAIVSDDGEQTESMLAAPGGNGDALLIQLQASLDAGMPSRALDLAEATGFSSLDEGCAHLVLQAAERCERFDVVVDVAEARLASAQDPTEQRALALTGGRAARDELHDDERAAALLYQAHQLDPEDIDVRIELTAVYARIPRLAAHAVTGILQLLRRLPDEPRIFALAANLADQQGQPDRAAAMRSITALLRGQPLTIEGAVRPGAPTDAVVPFDSAGLAARIGPTGWGGPLSQLLALLGPALEHAVVRPLEVVGARPLAQASPRSLALAERADRLLPGRVAQLMVADVDRLLVGPGAVPTIVLPADLLAHEAILLAAIARGLAVLRFSALVTEHLVDDGAELLGLLQAALLGHGAMDARAAFLRSQLRDDERETAAALLLRVLEAPDFASTARMLTRACDRFALVATGSPTAALAAGAVPSLWRLSPTEQSELVRHSARALDLLGFAARDNTWLARREHGL